MGMDAQAQTHPTAQRNDSAESKKINGKAIIDLFKETFAEYNEDKVARLAAALSYYTLFSLAPLLVIAIAIAGLVFGVEATQGQVVGQLRALMGEAGATLLQDMIRNASKPATSIAATIIGLVTLLLGAAGVVGQLQDSLNTIWEVQPKPDIGIGQMIKQRVFSFGMVLGTGFLLLVSLLLSAVVAALSEYASHLLPGADFLWVIVEQIVSLGITTALFALIFKFVPDCEIDWKDVTIGAAFTAVLFAIGRFVLARYLSGGSFGSTYGAAASVVVLLLWVYYSSQILFIGAEFTQIYARRFGSRIQPAPYAMAITEEARNNQGIPHKPDSSSTKPGETATRSHAETKPVQKQALAKQDPNQELVPRPWLLAVLGALLGWRLIKH